MICLNLKFDYWTAIGILNGETVSDAKPAGDIVKNAKVLGVPLEITELDSPFLLEGFRNLPVSEEDDIHRAYRDDKGQIVVLLDEPGLTSVDVFHSQTLFSYEYLQEAKNSESELLDNKPVIQLSYESENSAWSLFHIDVSAFEALIGEPSKLRSVTSYTIYRDD